MKPKHYLKNKELIEEIIISKNNDNLTTKTLNMFLLLSDKVTNMMSYSDPYYRQEALCGARYSLMLHWRSFKPEKSKNAFSYYTTVALNGAREAIRTNNRFLQGDYGFKNKDNYTIVSLNSFND